MVEDYSEHPNTIQTRRCYHNKTRKEKQIIFARQAKLKEAKVAEGKCNKCGKKRERVEVTMCDSCLKLMGERIKEYSINNALEGKCCKCPNPADGKSSHCVKCKEKARIAMRNRRLSPRMNQYTGFRYV